MKSKNNIPHLEDFGKQLEIIFSCSPGAHEIRVIGRYYITSLDGKRLERVLVKDSGDPQAYAINLARTPKEAIGLIEKHFTDYEAHNCYLAINRVSDNFKLKVKSFQIGDHEYPVALSCTKTKDIQGICALILDLDREDTPTDSEGVKLAASPEELKKIDEARREIVEDLEGYGLKPNYQICSGNGYQVVYFFPTQIEVAKTRKTLEIILDGLHEKYTGKVSVDTAMADPVRVARLCGLWNKKPDRALDEQQERIYRVASFLEGQSQLNSYENIQKLAEAMQAWQEKAKQRKKEATKTKLTESQKKPLLSSKGPDQEWIDQHLQKVALLPVLQRFYEIKVTGQSEGKTQLLCPYHDDHNPSAWIAINSNGVEIIHCSSPHCEVHDHPKTALHIIMENGYKFIWACLELFSEVPPGYIKTCYKCGQEVFLDGKTRYNITDRAAHKCQKQKKVSVVEMANGDKPLIEIVGGQLPAMVDAAEQALLVNVKQTQIYQRTGMLVRVNVWKTKKIKGLKRHEGALLIHPIDVPFLIEHFTRVAKWVKYDARKDDYNTEDCPKSVAETFLSRGSWQVPILTGIIEAPTLRPDGSILEIPGYDDETGLLFYPGITSFSPIPQTPTKEDAIKALEHYNYILQGFPFVEDTDRSVQIAAYLTSLIRYSIKASPIYGISAPKPRSGKSLLVDTTALITTGRPAAFMSKANSPEEEKKRLLAILIAGDPVIGIDNVEHPLASDALCSIITQEYWQERLLGKNKMVVVPTSVTWLVTGNNLQFQGDLTSRALLCTIDPQCERPEERNFNVNLYHYIPEHRDELVKAGLTILRAYHVAGRPKQDIKPYGGFEEWSDWIRSAIVWLGLPDPCQSRKKIEDADPVRCSLKILLSNWYACIKEPAILKDVIYAGKKEGNEGLYEALLDIAGEKGEINQRKLGQRLKAFEGRIEENLRLVQVGKNRANIALWVVRSIKEK